MEEGDVGMVLFMAQKMARRKPNPPGDRFRHAFEFGMKFMS